MFMRLTVFYRTGISILAEVPLLSFPVPINEI